MTVATTILAAGGTGGHVFPAIALAEALMQQGQRVILLADSRVAHYHFPDGLEVVILPTRSPAGGLTQKLQAMLALLQACWQAWRLMGQLPSAPQAVVGFGGYPAFPGVVSAILRRIPLILHEQNRVFGKVNRWLAPYARQVALSFPQTTKIDPNITAKCHVTGNPARDEILHLRQHAAYTPPTADGPLNLLVLGGSLGSTLFSEVIPDAITALPTALKQRLHLTQQCRAEDLATVKARYESEGITAHLASFFDDMAQQLTAAHLIICRAGASTVTEMMIAGRPAIYIPLAIAAEDHQTRNAQYLESENAGWLIPQSQFEPDPLATRITHCLTHPQILHQTATAAKQLAIPDAAERLMKLVNESP